MKNQTHSCVGRFKRLAALILTVLAFAASSVTINAAATPFSRIIALGDSLSDTGNFYALSGGWPPPPYDDGRFSNGPLWLEYLATGLGIELLAEDNYAVGGATTGFLNSNNGFAGNVYPALQQQVAALLADHPTGLDSNALYLLWAGSNDFFVVLESGGDPASLIANGVANTVSAIQALWGAGARHIMVVNVPDLGIIPLGRESGIGPLITVLSTLYNEALAGALDALREAGISTIQVDAFATLQRMVNFPAEFGFSNVSDSSLFTGGDPGEFLFWDMVHPTTRGHEIFGAEALNRLIEHFSPRQGKGSPPARVNALNGLVRASRNR